MQIHHHRPVVIPVRFGDTKKQPSPPTTDTTPPPSTTTTTVTKQSRLGWAKRFLPLGIVSALLVGGTATQSIKPVPPDHFVVENHPLTGQRELHTQGLYWNTMDINRDHYYKLGPNLENFDRTDNTADGKPLRWHMDYRWQITPENVHKLYETLPDWHRQTEFNHTGNPLNNLNWDIHYHTVGKVWEIMARYVGSKNADHFKPENLKEIKDAIYHGFTDRYGEQVEGILDIANRHGVSHFEITNLQFFTKAKVQREEWVPQNSVPD